MRKLLSIFTIALLYFTVAYGQPAAVDIPVTVSDNAGSTSDIYFGLDLMATDGIDTGIGEAELPGFPPSGYAAAWLLPDFVTMTYNDYRAPGSPPAFPFTGTISYTIRLQNDVANNPMAVSWNLPPTIATTSTITAGTQVLSFSGTGSISFNYNPAPGPTNLQFVFIEVDYNGIGPAGPEPHFAIAPPSLNFGPVGVGLSATLPATVSNNGTDPLTISDITSTNAQFTFTPNTFPISIPAGGNLVFNITFSPTTLGPFSANIVFTHDGTNATSPFN
jgi:hypothetical protein